MESCSWALFLRRRSQPFDGQINDDPVTVQARRIVSSEIIVPGPDEQTRKPASSRSDTQTRTPVSSAGGLAQ